VTSGLASFSLLASEDRKVGLAERASGCSQDAEPFAYVARMPSTTVVDSEDEREFLLTLGQRVRKRRRDADLTQAELAEAANLDRRWVGHLERGQTNISVLNLRRIAEALSCPLMDLLDEG
jgi:DNA-binding XRE family transcriptional regulator